jgi:putative ABC transport system permease protein
VTLRSLAGRLRTLVTRRRVLGDYDAQVAAHLADLAADLERSGLTPQEARLEARRQFGGLDQAREAYRDASGFPALDTLAQDVRYSLRMIRRQPVFSLIIVALVAIGIGANTAIFSLIDGVLLRPLPYPEPDRLTVVRTFIPAIAGTYPSAPVASGGFLLWQARASAFERMAAIQPETDTLTGAGTPARVEVARVTATLFPLLGVQAAVGRVFGADEDRQDHDSVVVLANGFWQDRFGGDPAAIGRRIVLNDRPYTVIGVLPRTFALPKHDQLGALSNVPSHLDIYRPAAFSDDERQNTADNFIWIVLGRLAKGATRAQAESQIDAVQADIVRETVRTLHIQPIEFKALVIPLQEQVVGRARRGLLLLAWSVGAVLLVLCVNLAALLLARVSSRTREAAIRVALGASRGRVVRQIVLENLLLAASGGLLGVLLARWTVDALVAGAPVDLPRLDEVQLNADVLTFAVALSAITGIAFSLLPAWHLARSNPQAALHATARSVSESVATHRLRRLLVTAQVALSTVLLVTAALLVASFLRLTRLDTGFDVEHVVFADLALSGRQYEADTARVQFFDRLLQRVRALPGVERVAVVSHPPLSGEAQIQTATAEHDTRALSESPMTNFRFVDPAYFGTLGIALKRGRVFDDRDRGRCVAVLNERAASAIWPGRAPLGLLFHRGGNDTPLCEVVGIVADTREVSLQKASSLIGYVPYWTSPPWQATVVLKTGVQPASMAGPLRQAIWGIDPGIPVPTVTTFESAVEQAVAPNRFQMLLVGAFAFCALVLASLGIYGVPAFAVARRTQELGIRLALGARPSALIRAIVSEGLLPVLLGLVLGVLGAVAAGRLVEGLLFDVSAKEPAAYAAVIAIVTGVALVACYLPARRIMRIDPVQSLRWD